MHTCICPGAPPLKIYLLGFNEAVLFTWGLVRNVENKEVVTNVSMITFYSKRLSAPSVTEKGNEVVVQKANSAGPSQEISPQPTRC